MYTRTVCLLSSWFWKQFLAGWSVDSGRVRVSQSDDEHISVGLESVSVLYVKWAIRFVTICFFWTECCAAKIFSALSVGVCTRSCVRMIMAVLCGRPILPVLRTTQSLCFFAAPLTAAGSELVVGGTTSSSQKSISATSTPILGKIDSTMVSFFVHICFGFWMRYRNRTSCVRIWIARPTRNFFAAI